MLNAVLGSPLSIKTFIIPVILIILAIVVYCVSRGSLYAYSLEFIVEATAMFAYMLITYGGGLMFIPAVLLSGWLAERKNDYLYKLPLSAFLLFSELHVLIFYGYDISDSAIIILQMGFLLFVDFLPILLPIYLIMLPLIIADELAARKHEKFCGTRIKGIQSAAWWGVTAAVMIAAAVLFGIISASVKLSEEEDIKVKKNINIHAAAHTLLDKYEDEMRTVSDYAAAHEYYDWYCCPDESVRAEWEALFADDSEYEFDYILDENYARRISVYISGEGVNDFISVGFDGESIYVDNALYIRTEGENEI